MLIDTVETCLQSRRRKRVQIKICSTKQVSFHYERRIHTLDTLQLRLCNNVIAFLVFSR